MTQRPDRVKRQIKRKHLSYVDAAEQILRSDKQSLSYKDLAKRALSRGLIDTDSETPAISMHVSIRGEMKRRELRGEPQRFTFLGNGTFSLVELESSALTPKTKTALDQVRESRREAAQRLYGALTANNNGPNFETVVADLLVAMRFQNVRVIGGKDDRGVDITCEKRDGVLTTRIAIQCKCKVLEQKIGPKDISTLRDNLSTFQCQQGIRITGPLVWRAPALGREARPSDSLDSCADAW